MTIGAGTKLGRYEIRSKIGEGGMGEVYLAEDTLLHRRVAIKFLSSEVAQNRERLGRFEQEAFAASALNHPNILTVFEIGESDSVRFIATEYVDGETLRQRMKHELSKRWPNDTLLNNVWLPVIRAQLELRRGNLTQAIQLLETTRRYERAGFFEPQYLRGQIYLAQSKGKEAAAEFQTILNHRGWYPSSALYPLGQLGLARAAVLQGDTAKARRSYQDFFALWKDADADNPVLIKSEAGI